MLVATVPRALQPWSSRTGTVWFSVVLTLILLFSPTIQALSSFTIHFDHGKEIRCFQETLAVGNRLDLSYEVSTGSLGGKADDAALGGNVIDLWITGPSQNMIKSIWKSSEGKYGFVAEAAGVHKYCFSNQASTLKSVMFVVHGPNEAIKFEEEAVKTPVTGVSDEDTNSFTEQVRLLLNYALELQDEQAYLILRAKTHEKTAKSSNSRVLWWTLMQSFLLAGSCLFQVWYLRRIFTTKRTI